LDEQSGRIRSLRHMAPERCVSRPAVEKRSDSHFGSSWKHGK
jgi:hypothetical protein